MLNALALFAVLGASARAAVSTETVRSAIETLSSDEFEGRAPASEGEKKTLAYLTERFKSLGLAPGNPDGTYLQKVPMVGAQVTNRDAKLVLRRGADVKSLAYADDYMAVTKRIEDKVAFDAPLVFVGYGVEAPEFNWNDFKDVDVKGKTLVVLVNDPAVPDPSDTSKLDPKMFGGNAMTYYGRWTYKYEEGARKGAAGILVVHETGPAGYPFSVVQGNLREKFDLVTPDKNMGRSAIEGWITLDTARRILKMAGQDFDALKKRAVTREFKPVPLGLQASLAIGNTLRTIDSQNVIAKLEGSDARLKDEYVVYTAHWDHLGVGTPVKGDAIYNGALDNASGMAALLEIAGAFTKVEPKPKRSVLFLMVTAEEQGLLGSQHYSVSPLYPLERTVANINIDGVNQWGRTKDITVVGMGASDLDDYLSAAAAEQGRTLRPDPEPEKGFYYRSDHFNFAKQGVPALYVDTGVDFIGKDPSYATTKREEYTSTDYHSPSDHIKPDWDLSGAVEDALLMLTVGYRVANADTMPEWKPGNEFKAKRDSMLKK